MENNAVLEDVLTSNEVLKLSALLYLKEALEEQKYELCADLVQIAQQFGATQGDVTQVITAFLRGEKGEGPKQPKTQKNRLKSLLKENE